MTELAPEIRDVIVTQINEHGFLSWLDVEVEALEAGRITLCVPFAERFVNDHQSTNDSQGTIHGGVAATLVDTAGGFAIRSALDHPFETELATIELNLSYLQPATGRLAGTGEVIRIGRSIGVAEVTVDSPSPAGDSETIAVGRVTYRIFR